MKLANWLTSFLSQYFIILRRINLNDDTRRLKHCDVLFFCHDVDRGVSLNGKAYAPLCDSVREYCVSKGLRCITIAHPWSKHTGARAFGAPIAINRSYFFDRLTKKLHQLLNINLFVQKNVFEKILKKTGALLIITIGSPNDLSHAARKGGVFHIELLHGQGYSFVQWGWDRLPPDSLPQGVLSLDEVSTRAFRELEHSGIVVRQIPHPFLRRFLPGKQSALPNEWIYNRSYSDKYKKTVLISLQWGYAEDHGDHWYLKDILNNGLFYEEIAELVAERRDIFWRFRFHPVQLRQRKYQYLLDFMDNFVAANPNSEWRESSFLPIPSVAMNCDCNITMSSMASYDVAAIGLPSLLLCPSVLPGGALQNSFEDLVKEGYATKSKIAKRHVYEWISNARQTAPRIEGLDDDEKWEETFREIFQIAGLEKRIVVN
ncbi:hypothetical protein AOB54_01760 [beta proteobacterium MWH-UniP1]